MESPSNPLVNLVDIRAVCRLARARGITTVVDSTFASPCFQRPLDLGADVVVHSTTKYLNGHSDVVGGAVISKSAQTGRRIADLASELGTPCSPFDAWLVLRGLRTLPIRMQAHQRNATALAKFLEKRRDVRRVHYPGLRSHPQHALAKRQMSGFGGMLSFEIRGGRREVFRLFGRLRLFASAASLGGVESLIEHPATLSHAPLTPEARAAAGISDGLIRVSAGIEDPDDLVRDMEQALDAL
jgi:cystathionine beta-lyase/cystathionine gamma-synthase